MENIDTNKPEQFKEQILETKIKIIETQKQVLQEELNHAKQTVLFLWVVMAAAIIIDTVVIGILFRWW